jgi:copper(I)-binding protein
MMGVKSVPVPAHGSVSFAPGGYHLMCMQPKDMKPGGTATVTLSFKDGTSLKGDFPIKGATGQ